MMRIKSPLIQKLLLVTGLSLSWIIPLSAQHKNSANSSVNKADTLTENSRNTGDEIYRQLVKNHLFKYQGKKGPGQKQKAQLIYHLKNGFFHPSPETFFTYYEIDGETLVEDGFKTYLTRIAEGLKKRGCKALIGAEYEAFDNSRKSRSGESYWTHWIVFNGEKELIFEGFLGQRNDAQIYLNRLVDLVDKALLSGNRPERVYLIGTYDGVLLCLLTDEEYQTLKTICAPLKNSFVK